MQPNTQSLLVQGQNFTDSAGRTAPVNFDTVSGIPLAPGQTTPAPVPTTLNIKDIQNTKAPVLPAPVATTPAGNGLAVTNAAGVATATNDIAQAAKDATAATKATTDIATPTNTRQSYLDQILKGIGIDATKGDFTENLNTQYDVAGKQQALNDINNKITTTSRSYDQQAKTINANAQGKFGPAVVQDLADLDRKKNEDLANLNIIKSVSLNDVNTANDIIDKKVAAKFEPIENNIKNLEQVYQLTANDLTDSEKMQAQAKIDAAKQKVKDNSDAYSNVVKNAAQNGAPQSVLSAIDKAASNPNATQASIYAAAGRYSVSIADRQKLSDGNGGSVPSPYIPPSYTLQAGDDPYNIAQKAGTDVKTLQQLNPQIKDWNNIQPGVKLNLPNPSGQLSNNPNVDAYAQGILNGSITSFASVPKQYKDAVAKALNAPGQNGYSPLAGSRYTMESNRIVNNFVNTPAYQLTAGGQLYLTRIAAAMKTPGSVSDQDLLDSLTKLNTGGNAISDAQVRLITDGKSLTDTANTLYNKLGNGGVLSTKQRNQIQEIAKNIFENYQTAYQPVYDQATSQLKAAGVPKAFWTIPDLNDLNAKANAAQNSAPATSGTLSSGITYTVVK